MGNRFTAPNSIRKEGTNMKQMKRWVSMLLIFCLIVSLAPMTVSAAESGTCGDNVKWSLSSSGVLTISGTGPMADYEPDERPWASSADTVKSVVITSGVTTIGRSAFYYCTSLTKVTIPNTVTSIGDYAFGYCSNLTGVSLPDSLISMGDGVFTSCSNLRSLTIPNSVTAIGDGAFDWCENMTSITLGNRVTSIGEWTFSYCTNLTSVTIPDSVTSIGDWAFQDCTSLTNIIIPDRVTSIGESAFASCRALNHVTIGKSVTSIGENAFSSCDSLAAFSVTKQNPSYASDKYGMLFDKAKTTLIQAPAAYVSDYTVPDGVRSIGDRAFAYSPNLTSVSIPASVTSIGESAFAGCTSLTGIYVDSNNPKYTSDTYGVLFDKAMTTLIQAPGGYSGHYSIPKGVTSIGDAAFIYCMNLSSMTIPDTVTTIGESAFFRCENLTSATIPDSVMRIGDYAFSYCYYGLTDVSIGNGVTYIGNETFLSCFNLTNLTIGKNVNTIAPAAFGWCFSLTDIFFLGDAPKIKNEAFLDVTATAYYPTGNTTWTSKVKKNYGGDINWVSYDNTVKAPVVKASNVASSGKIQLTWNEINNAEEYKVYRATSKNGAYKLIKTTTGTSFTNSSVKAGEAYYYYVVAVNKLGIQSDKSNIVNRTCDLPQPKVTLSNVASSGKIKVSWEAIDGAKEYKVYRATSKDGEYKLIKTTTNTSLTNTSTTAGTAYYYKVKAVAEKSAADSAYSAIKSRTCDLPRPDATISLNSSGKPKVSWEAVDGAVSYKVYRATSKSGDYKLMKTTATLSYTNTSAEAGKTYYYKVVAVCANTAGNSTYSNTVSIKSQ